MVWECGIVKMWTYENEMSNLIDNFIYTFLHNNCEAIMYIPTFPHC